MKRIVHVDQHRIRHNLKTGDNVPPLTLRTYKGTEKAHELIIRLPDGSEAGRFVYRGESPLSCGARVWFETHLDVEIASDLEEAVA